MMSKVKKGDQCPGRRRGRQDKPSGTEIYGACVRGRGGIRIQVRGQKGRKGYIDIKNKKTTVNMALLEIIHQLFPF